MNADALEFNRGAIRPMACWSAGWQLVKEQYWLTIGMSLVGMLLGAVGPMGILVGAMMCGMNIVLLSLMRGERVEFGMLFKGFDYFVPAMFATFIKLGIILAGLIPAYVVFFVLFFVAAAANSGAGQRGAPVALGLLIAGGVALFLFVFALSMTVSVCLLFAYPLIVDRKLSAWEACKTSTRAARGNLSGALGLLVLNALASLGGLLLCYFGVFFVLPIQYAAVAVAYRSVFPDLGYALTNVASPRVRTSD